MISASTATQSVIEIEGLSKTYVCDRMNHKALNNVSLRVHSGQMVGLIGASGSGKSTMLRHLTGLVAGDRTSNNVRVLGKTVQKNGMLSRDVRRVRARVGFIFQQFNIVHRLSVLSNVLAGTLGRIPSWRGAAGRFTQSEKKEAMAALSRVGMAKFAMQRASTLSGGQQQRVAIARALTQGAEIIIADEPIASLDPVSSRNVMEILSQINREDGKTVLVSLHQVDYALRYCGRIIALKHGEIIYDGPSAGLTVEMLHDVYGDRFLEACLDEEMVSVNRCIGIPSGGNGRSLPAEVPVATY